MGSGALKIAKLSKMDIMIFSDKPEKKYTDIYVTCRIRTTSNSNYYKSRMISFWLSAVNGKESKLSKLMYTKMFKEQDKGLYDFKWIRCINDILVSVGRPDLFRKDSTNNPKAVKLSISRALCDLYTQKWNVKINVSSKGKQYLLFKDNLCFEKKLKSQYFTMIKLLNLELAITDSQLRLEGGTIRL